MKRLAFVLLLGGCATTDRAVVTGNAVSVTVNNVWNANQGFAVAERHCAQYGKVARQGERVGEYAFAYDCVNATDGTTAATRHP